MQNQFYTIGSFLQEHFGGRVVKLSIDGGFTCPNRDGTLGVGGCSFCSPHGSGELAGSIPDQIRLLSDKWPDARYLAYFQSHTNTYAPLSVLKEKFEAALDWPGVVGLAVATRPDCLPEEVLNYLEELNQRTFLWVELGLQTSHESTAGSINRCYDLTVYDEAVKNLTARGIRIVTHLIFGLPGETREQMLQSVDYVCSGPIFGIKFHMLNLVKGSVMAEAHPDYVSFEQMEDYVELAAEAILRVPPGITIHRITGDVPRKLLISPEWSYQKRTILNNINKRLADMQKSGKEPDIEKAGSHSPSLPSL